MRILITGGAGFIGSHLAEHYLTQGHDVSILDNLSTGSRENIAHLEKKSGYAGRIHFHRGDILDRELMYNLVFQCDFVFHLAAAVGVQYIIDHPLETIITNIKGTETMFRICSQTQKRILAVSTSEVYGKQSHSPLVETDDIVYGPVCKSRWGYAASKLVNEHMALAYHKTHGLDVVICRLFNTIGPRQTGAYGMVVPRFVDQALQNKPITVYGSGEQTRTFTFVGDVVTSISMLMEAKDISGQVFNVGGDQEIKIIDLASKIVSKANSHSTIQRIPYDEAFTRNFEDMPRRVPSVEKLKRTIGYVPNTSLDKMLGITIRSRLL